MSEPSYKERRRAERDREHEQERQRREAEEVRIAHLDLYGLIEEADDFDGVKRVLHRMREMIEGDNG